MGLSAARGVLEDDADLAAPQLVPAVRQNVNAGHLQAFRAELRGGIQDAGDRVRRERLAGTALADESDELSGANIEIDAVDGRRARRRPRRNGSSDRRIESKGAIGRSAAVIAVSGPEGRAGRRRHSENVRIAIISAAPGKTNIHHSPEKMLAAPSETMMPHSACGARTPRPMNDRPAAFRIAQPRLSED